MEQYGQVTARMETMPAMGTPSISVSQQQPPKKFAPVVAPKPKFNPYKAPEDPADGREDYPPPPPPDVHDVALSFAYPPPPPTEDFSDMMRGPAKTLQERRSSLDAEIDSLTSILADLESSSPYKPRNTQNSVVPQATSPNVPVTGYKRMVIPTQPPLTAHTKKIHTQAPGSRPGLHPRPPPPSPVARPSLPRRRALLRPPAAARGLRSPSRPPTQRPPPPASPTYNVQVRPAQPGPQQPRRRPQQQTQQPPTRRCAQGPVHSGSSPRGPDFAYGPPQPGFAPHGGYVDQQPHYPASTHTGGGGAWRPEAAPPAAVYAAPPDQGPYQPPGPNKKTYITDPPASLAPYSSGSLAPQKGSVYWSTNSQAPNARRTHCRPGCPRIMAPAPGSSARPEEELERLTKKMLFDMDHPPSEEYFGRCASCGENVVGEGTGCTAMDQVFHVDCFVCMTCSSKLRGKPFYAVEKKAYCEPCYINTLELCTICSKPIMERILRATGKAYHPHCFSCVVCHRSLDGIPFTVDAANHIHCIEDFHKKFAPRCTVCSEPIMPAPGQEETVRIVALDRDFHVQCYRCEDCQCLLSEGDNQGCYPLDGHVLCKTCNTSRIQALTAKPTTDL
ncbi:lipoma-preferred partner [Aplochiton taeniatus]